MAKTPFLYSTLLDFPGLKCYTLSMRQKPPAYMGRRNGQRMRNEDNNERKSDYILQSVDHALQMMELLGKKSPIGVGEAAKILGMGKSTAFRLLSTLEYRGFVKKDTNSKYRLGLKVANLGAQVLDTFDISKIAHPHLEELSTAIGETVHLVILSENNNACFIDKVVCPNTSFRMESMIGAQKSAYSTGTGKVLLAYKDQAFQENYVRTIPLTKYTDKTIADKETLLAELKKIRALGYGFDEEESEQGLFCIAAPVFDYTGHAVAAISASGPSVRMRQKQELILDKIREISRRISAELE